MSGYGEWAGAGAYPAQSQRFSYVPPHVRRNAFPAPVAGQDECFTGAWYAGHHDPRPRDGTGRNHSFRDPNPSGIDSDEMRNLRISEPTPSADFSGNGIDFNAYDDIPVETSGSDVPPPAATFAEINLGEALNRNIQRCQYVKPTPVQRYAIPISLAGRDLMACAQTGSGKTAAFCFPIISGIISSSRNLQNGHNFGGSAAYPLALILSPTRELSCQIHDEAKKFSYQTGVKICVVYGGTPAYLQYRDLKKGVDILVATPGRLIDMIERDTISLQKVKYLVLDEADRMLDMGFEPQIRKIVMQMNMPLVGSRQTMLFSATFPHSIQRLASDFLSNYIFLTVGRIGSSTELIKQKVEFVSDMDKRSQLMTLLRSGKLNGINAKPPLTLIFVETKRGADVLKSWLCKNGFPATAIHGDRNQQEREQALKSFKCGATPLMVATDVAARGLDIPHVAHVINFDLPKDIDGYVHRIGRTGRAGKSGLATAFFSDANQPLAKALVEVMQESCQEVPDWLLQCAGRSSHPGENIGCRGGKGRFGGRDIRNDSMPHFQSQSFGNGLRSYGNNDENGGAGRRPSYARENSGYRGGGSTFGGRDIRNDNVPHFQSQSYGNGPQNYGYNGTPHYQTESYGNELHNYGNNEENVIADDTYSRAMNGEECLKSGVSYEMENDFSRDGVAAASFEETSYGNNVEYEGIVATGWD